MTDMNIKGGLCLSFKRDILNGVHRPEHAYRMALYGADANLGPDTQTYQAAGEVAGSGYEAGGIALTGRKVAQSGSFAYLTWADAVWPNATISARGALVYNDSLPGKNSVVVLEFGEQKTGTNAPYKVEMPEGGLVAL